MPDAMREAANDSLTNSGVAGSSDILMAEFDMLLMYDLDRSDKGLKVHNSDASPAMLQAANRLHHKGLIDQPDGGYLTAIGREAAEHLQRAARLVRAS